MEFGELKRLEKRMKKVEKEKVRLLGRESYSENVLMLQKGKHTLDLKEIE